jgi:hypothetical protein
LALWIAALSFFPLRIFRRSFVAEDSWCESSFGFDVGESLSGGVPRLLSGHSLPTLDCSVHIEWIDLDAATVPAGALGGKGLPSLI